MHVVNTGNIQKQPLQFFDCGGCLFLLLEIEGSMKNSWPVLWVRMVGHGSCGQQRVQNGHSADVIKFGIQIQLRQRDYAKD